MKIAKLAISFLVATTACSVAFANNVVSPADISEKTYGPASSSKKRVLVFRL